MVNARNGSYSGSEGERPCVLPAIGRWLYAMTRKGTFSSLSVFATLLLVATLAIPKTSAFAEDSPKASPEPVQASALTEDMTEEDAQGTLGNASSGAAQRVAADPASTEDAAESLVSAEASGSVSADAVSQGATGITIKDGMAQPVFAYSSTKTKGYANACFQTTRPAPSSLRCISAIAGT